MLHSLSCGKHKVLKRIAAAVPAVEGAVAGEKEKEKEKGQGGLIKITDSFIFNASFRYTSQVKPSILAMRNMKQYFEIIEETP